MRRLVWIGIILGSDLLFAIEGLGFSFDAKKTSMNSKTNAYQFDGNVVAIGSGILIIADLITVTEQPRRIWAKGNLAILAENQLVLGDELIYLPSEKILRIKDANMSFNARDKAQAFINDVLGFTEEEVDFEQKRQGHLVRLQGVMDNVIREYVFWYQNNGSEVDLMQLVHKYQKLKKPYNLHLLKSPLLLPFP